MIIDKEFDEWKNERDKAVAGSFDEFKAYATKMGVVPDLPEAFEIMYHKCRTGITSLPKEIQEASHQWLIERGYSSFK